VRLADVVVDLRRRGKGEELAVQVEVDGDFAAGHLADALQPVGTKLRVEEGDADFDQVGDDVEDVADSMQVGCLEMGNSAYVVNGKRRM
jgi:hypothetical protein